MHHLHQNAPFLALFGMMHRFACVEQMEQWNTFCALQSVPSASFCAVTTSLSTIYKSQFMAELGGTGVPSVPCTYVNMNGPRIHAEHGPQMPFAVFAPNISVYCSGVLRYDISSMTCAQSTPGDRSSMAEAPIILCPQCGYDLRGLLATRCPECGLDVDAVKATGTLIPFAYRQGIGFWRAYWKTVTWVIFRHKQFAQSASRPVDDGDARLFQHVTVLLASIPAAIAAIFLFVKSDLGILPEPMSSAPRPLEPLDVAWYPVLALCVWIFFFILTRMPRYAFRSRHPSPELRNHLMSLTCFAAAPFVWAFVPAALILLATLIHSAHWFNSGFGRTLFWLSIALIGLAIDVQFSSWVIGPGKLAEVSRGRNRWAAFWRTWIAPLMVIVSATVIGLVVMPLAYALVAILIDSLR